jgi:hypothetical protein
VDWKATTRLAADGWACEDVRWATIWWLFLWGKYGKLWWITVDCRGVLYFQTNSFDVFLHGISRQNPDRQLK